MKSIVACAALVAATGSAAAQQQDWYYLAVDQAAALIDLGPNALAAATICVLAPDNGEVEITVDGNVRMIRGGKGNCGSVSGRQIVIRSAKVGTVTVQYRIDAISLRPGG